jgi:hypothetical protein
VECFGAVSHLLSVPGTAVAPGLAPDFTRDFHAVSSLAKSSEQLCNSLHLLVKQRAYRCSSSLFECPSASAVPAEPRLARLTATFDQNSVRYKRGVTEREYLTLFRVQSAMNIPVR